MKDPPDFNPNLRPEEWITRPAIADGRRDKNKANDHDGTHYRGERGELECALLEPIGANKIPPRSWAYGQFLLFGSAGVIGAVDGAGKGAIAVVIAIAMITGRPLLGERVWRAGPVAIVT